MLLCENGIKGKIVDKEKKRNKDSESERESKSWVTEHQQDQQDQGTNPLATVVSLRKDLRSTLFLLRKKAKNLRKDLNDEIHIPY